MSSTACPHAPCAAHRIEYTILCPLYKNIGEKLRHTSICAAQKACVYELRRTILFSSITKTPCHALWVCCIILLIAYPELYVHILLLRFQLDQQPPYSFIQFF